MGHATLRQIAVNAVMAGCEPEYLPVVVAALQAVSEPHYGLAHRQTTTHAGAPLIIVNGPIVERLAHQLRARRVRSRLARERDDRPRAAPRARQHRRRGPGVDDFADAAIPASTRTASPRTRRPIRGSRCTSSAASRSDQSVVTVVNTEAPHSMTENIQTDPDEIVRTFASCMATLGVQQSVFAGQPRCSCSASSTRSTSRPRAGPSRTCSTRCSSGAPAVGAHEESRQVEGPAFSRVGRSERRQLDGADRVGAEGPDGASSPAAPAASRCSCRRRGGRASRCRRRSKSNDVGRRILVGRAAVARSLLVSLACVMPRLAAGFAETYPDKPVRMVIAFAPGGGTDVVGRLIAQKLSSCGPSGRRRQPARRGFHDRHRMSQAVRRTATRSTVSMSHALNVALYGSCHTIRSGTSRTSCSPRAHPTSRRASFASREEREGARRAREGAPSKLAFSSSGTGRRFASFVEVFRDRRRQSICCMCRTKAGVPQ